MPSAATVAVKLVAVLSNRLLNALPLSRLFLFKILLASLRVSRTEWGPAYCGNVVGVS